MQSAAVRIAGVIALALSAAGCTATGQQAGGLQPGQRSTVAFESIEGPPPAVFQRLVRKLNDEAEIRQVPVVSREGFAPYRVRGYVAVGVRKGQAVIAWVWDVYDAQSGRAMRLSGEEKAGRAGRDAWQAVNDEVLARIARNGMEQLAGYFGGSDNATPPVPNASPSAIAENNDFRPESDGIKRRPSAGQDAGSAPSATPARTAPVPPRRPPAPSGRVAFAEPR